MKELHVLLYLVLCRPLYASTNSLTGKPTYAKCVGRDSADDRRCDNTYKCGSRPILDGYNSEVPCNDAGRAACTASEHKCNWFDPATVNLGPVEALPFPVPMDDNKPPRPIYASIPKYRPPVEGLCVDIYDLEPRSIRKVITENDVPMGTGPMFERALDKCRQLCNKFRFECQGYTFPINTAAIPWCTLYGPAMTDQVKVDKISNAHGWKWHAGKDGVDIAGAYSLSPEGRGVNCYIKDRRLLNVEDEGMGKVSNDHYVCVYNTVNIDTPKADKCSGSTAKCGLEDIGCGEPCKSRAIEVCSQDCQVKWPTSTGCDNMANGHCRYFDNVDGVWCQCEKCDVSQEKLKLSCTGCTTVVFNNDNYDADKPAGSQLTNENADLTGRSCEYNGKKYNSQTALTSLEGCRAEVTKVEGQRFSKIGAAEGATPLTKAQYENLNEEERRQYIVYVIPVLYNGAANLSIGPGLLLIPLLIWMAGV